MAFIQKSNGNYLLLVHGALTDGSMWSPHLSILEPDFDVLAVSMGHFDKPTTEGFGLNSHAQELADLLRNLPEQKPINIAAWSYGADVVLNMLVQYDLAITKVLLYEPGYPGCLDGHDMDAWQADANAMFGKVFEDFSNGNLELAVESLIDGSGNMQGYFQSQEPAVKQLQLAKAYTLEKQLNL